MRDWLCGQLQACVDQLDVSESSSTYNRRLNEQKKNTALSALLTLQLIEKPLELPLSPCTCPACSLLPGFDSPSVNNSITPHRHHCICALYDAAAAAPAPLAPHASPVPRKISRANVCQGRLVAHFCTTAHVWAYLLSHREILALLCNVESKSVWAWFTKFSQKSWTRFKP